MGKQTNPNIIRLGKTQNWKSKYIEKKISETPEYVFKNLEIKKLIHKFFRDKGLAVNNCKINFSSEGSLHIFISCYLTLKSTFLINNINNRQKVEFSKNLQNKKVRTTKHLRIKKDVKNYTKYNNLDTNAFIKNIVSKTAWENVKKNTSKQIRRINLLKYYKNFLVLQKFEKPNDIKMNLFLEQIIKSLHLFLEQETKVVVTLQLLNKSLKRTLTQEKLRVLKKSLVKLKKYNQNDFLKEGVNVLTTSITQTQGSKLLSYFISDQLAKLKRHNFFLKFLKTALTILKNKKFSSVKGMKIKIKGRFNGVPRAKHKIINIGEGVPIITLNSNIDYSEFTSYTPNGTFGVKVWIYYKS